MLLAETMLFSGGLWTDKQEELLGKLIKLLLICGIILVAIIFIKAILSLIFDLLSDFIELPMKFVTMNLNIIHWVSIIGLVGYFLISAHHIMSDFWR